MRGFHQEACAVVLSGWKGLEVGFIVFCAKHTVGLQKGHFKMNCTRGYNQSDLPDWGEGDFLETWAPETAIHLQAFPALPACCLFMDLFHNKSSLFKDTVNILKFSSVSRGSVFFVDGYAAGRLNFPETSVFSGLPCVINSEEAFICCGLNVYLLYP